MSSCMITPLNAHTHTRARARSKEVQALGQFTAGVSRCYEQPLLFVRAYYAE